VRWWKRFLEWLRKLFGGAAGATVGCIDFSAMATGSGYPNPWNLTGPNGGTATFETINPPGSTNPGPAANNRVHSLGGTPPAPVGLDCNFTLEIKFPAASQLSFTMYHSAQPATIEAFDSSGTVVGSGAQPPPPWVVNTVNVPAPGSERAVVHSPSDEVVLIEFCAT
jgi:hypothetical protein